MWHGIPTAASVAIAFAHIVSFRGAVAVPLSRLPLGSVPSGFSGVQPETRILGPQVVPITNVDITSGCAEACLARGGGCIGFNVVNTTDGMLCEVSGYGPEAAIVPTNGSAFFPKAIARNDSRVEPAVTYSLAVPTRGVTLTSGPFAVAFATNIAYLSQFPVNDILYWFRMRAGVPNPPNATSWGWDGHVQPTEVADPPGGRNIDGPYGLRGSVAGAFMMGAGGATRWAELPELSQRLGQVVENISALQGSDGFAMAFLRNETNNHEDPNYVQSWVTHGLLEADAAGVEGATAVLRRHFDWFNYNTTVLANMLPPNSGPGPVNCTPDQRDHGHCVYLIYQGMIHNTRVAGSSVGTARDVQVVQSLYQENWWLEALAARNLSQIWQRQSAHNYEITAFEAYFDMYVLTGEPRYLAAVEGAWDMMRGYWIHVGGSIAINEGGTYPPGSYYLNTKPTGELCGSSFWIRLNQRFHRLRPSQEVYTTEIERSLLNVILANQAAPDADPPGIRYFAVLEGQKATPTNYVTCCESQGTRTYGALPEFIYSTTADGTVFVNLYAPSVFRVGSFALVQTTGFPTNGSVTLAVARTQNGTLNATQNAEGDGEASSLRVMLRIPSWLQASTVPVTVKNADGSVNRTLSGKQGTYLPLELAVSEVVEVTFAMGLRVSLYNGSTPADASRCNSPDVTRAAVEWGPLLLAATYSADPRCRPLSASTQALPAGAPTVSIFGVDPRTPVDSWLQPSGLDKGDPLFSVVGTAGCVVFRPYYRLQNESFSVYPNFLPTAGRNQSSQCGVTQEAGRSEPPRDSTVCLVCPVGQVITAIADSQFGVIEGNCSAGFNPEPSCAANSSLVKSVAKELCLGQEGCSVPVDCKLFGKDPCPGVLKSLALSVECAPAQCDIATENWPQETNAVHVGCMHNQTIEAIVDAKYGVVTGTCSSGFSTPGCHADPQVVQQVVATQCVGKAGCTVSANHVLFGKDPCVGTVKELAVAVRCA
eukprot:m.219527 g.219527  ORF g.219527 m.219527 type:complete len:991 (+) comp15583_c0_seq1:238-3210(+)